MTLISTQITYIVASVGFPIAAFMLMYKFATETLKENTRAIERLTLALTEKFK